MLLRDGVYGTDTCEVHLADCPAAVGLGISTGHPHHERSALCGATATPGDSFTLLPELKDA